MYTKIFITYENIQHIFMEYVETTGNVWHELITDTENKVIAQTFELKHVLAFQ